METNIDDEVKECIIHWKIENISNCWWIEDGKMIESPTFIANALLGTKWSLRLYLKGKIKDNFVGLFLKREKDCSGPNCIEVSRRLAFLGKGGSLLAERIATKENFSKGERRGYLRFVERERVFFTEREAFLPKDTLTVLCSIKKIDKTPDPTKHLYGRTVMNTNSKSFVWKIEGMSTLETDSRYEFKDTLFHFHLILDQDFDELLIDMISWYDGIKFVSFNVAVIDFEGKREECGIKNYFASDLKEGEYVLMQFPRRFFEDKSRYFPKDVITLNVEFAVSTIEYFGEGSNSAGSKNDVQTISDCDIKVEESRNKEVLIEDFKSLCNEGIFSDTEIRTSTKTFPAHKAILSARSNVFRRMFSNPMKEANSGHVDITDFEENTVHRMLLYLYTSTLEGLQFESATELYKIADKYQILSLKQSCSSFLKDIMCSNNVCDVLVLADLYQDVDLKDAAEAYILGHGEVFNSMEWKHFLDSNINLGSKIMLKKLNTISIYKVNM